MKFFNKPDAQIKEHLIKGERIIAWANHAGGKIYVTNFALLSFDHHENLRLPWELSLQGKWEEPLLTVVAQNDPAGALVTRAWQIPDPGLVPDAVRDRITSALLIDQSAQIPDLGEVRFIARKSPQGIIWTTLLPGNLTDQAGLNQVSQSHIASELNRLKDALGI